MKKKLRVETPAGPGKIEEFYVTELGYLMAKIYFPERKCWVNYKVGDLPKMSEGIGLKFIGFD